MAVTSISSLCARPYIPLSRSRSVQPNKHNSNQRRNSYTFRNKFSAGKTVDVTWYDGDKRPPKDIQGLLEGKRIPSQGSIFIGTNGVMLLPHIGNPELFPKATFADFKRPELPKINHWDQWVEACKGNGTQGLTLNMLVHLLRQCYLAELRHVPGKELKWDTKKLEFTNEPKPPNT